MTDFPCCEQMTHSQPEDGPRDLIAEFTIHGEPVSKARARFTGYGSATRAYTPAKTKDAQVVVRAAFKAVAAKHVPDNDHAYAVEAKFLNGTRQRRDVDNMLKLLLDGLNKVAWDDDNQVTEVIGLKIYLGDKALARTEVRIYRLGLSSAKRRSCEECGKDFITYDSLPNQRHCSGACFSESRRKSRLQDCEHCGVAFDRHGGSKRRFCSRECRSEAGRVTMNCTTCGAAFTKQISAAVKKGNHFCSTACQQMNQRPIRASAACGTCMDCGGLTSKRSYKRCNACSQGVAGKPKLVDADKKTDVAHMELRIRKIR